MTTKYKEVINGIRISNYYNLIEGIAKTVSKKTNGIVKPEELIGSGFEGLMQAARKFNRSKGLQFNTLATYRIKGAMLDYLRSCDWVPRIIRAESKKTGIEPTKIVDFSTLNCNFLDLPEAVKEKKDNTLIIFLRKHIFNGRTRDIMEKYYIMEKSIASIAKEYNVSDSRVSQILKEGLDVLGIDRVINYNKKEVKND